MSEMYRLRELAALLRPASTPVAEAKIPQGFDGIRSVVEDALSDLNDKLGEGGALETILDKFGLSDTAESTVAAMAKALEEFKQQVEACFTEAESMIHMVKEGAEPEPEDLDEALTDDEQKEIRRLNAQIARWQEKYGPGNRAPHAVGPDWDKTVKRIEALEKKRSKKITEMAKAGEFRGGANMFGTRKVKQLIASFRGGEEDFELPNGERYEFDKPTNGGALKKGDIVFALHQKYNTGAELYEILGFGGDDGKVKYATVKDALKATGTKNLKELEKYNEGKKDDEVRLIVKDLADGDTGAFFYLFEGRWCYGSGAEPLTFCLVKKTA